MLKQLSKNTYEYVSVFVKWVVIALITGIIGGITGSLFHIAIDSVTELRIKNEWLIYLLPLGGIIIAFVYAQSKKYGKLDTDRIIRSVQTEEGVPFILAPLIFFASTVTHLFGGSAGREGAALQLGGAIGYRIAKTARLSSGDIHTVVMTGMASVFAALFGTPVTAAVFAIEVSSVGIMHYGAFLPSVIASITACFISAQFGIFPVRFSAVIMQKNVTPLFVVGITVISVLCALVSILFCTSVKQFEKLGKKHIPNPYLRAFSGGIIIVLLTVIVGTYDYNGAGMDVIKKALNGNARYEAFALKILFTAITVASGFKGGEIVPTFFIGSTFGCVISSFTGIEPSVGAAIGFVALFCGVVNCPVASIFLAAEVFGASSLPLFAYVVAISYMLSGNYGLYKSQKIVYSKLDEHYIDVNAN